MKYTVNCHRATPAPSFRVPAHLHRLHRLINKPKLLNYVTKKRICMTYLDSSVSLSLCDMISMTFVASIFNIFQSVTLPFIRLFIIFFTSPAVSADTMSCTSLSSCVPCCLAIPNLSPLSTIRNAPCRTRHVQPLYSPSLN